MWRAVDGDEKKRQYSRKNRGGGAYRPARRTPLIRGGKEGELLRLSAWGTGGWLFAMQKGKGGENHTSRRRGVACAGSEVQPAWEKEDGGAR